MNVGQMYENRRTKKVGVVEEIDEKYKTILMRDENGGSFNITFSTFKSNWRKYAGDKKIETSSQVEETKEEATETIKKTEKKTKMSREDVYKTLDASYKIVEGIINSDYENFVSKMSSRGGIIIGVGSKKHCEFWIKPRTNSFNVRIPDVYLDILKENGFIKEGVEDVYFENEKTWMKHSVRGFELGSLDEIVREVLDTIVDVLSSEEEEGEE